MLDLNTYSQTTTPKRLGKTLLLTAVFNTAIAVLLTTIGFGPAFVHTLIFAQCIGLTICTCVVLTLHLSKNANAPVRGIMLGVALSAGTAIGTAIGVAAIGLPMGGFHARKVFLWKIVGVSIMFGLIITYFFHSKEKLAASMEMAHEERIKRLSSEKSALEANLKRLQAQVEPHFLFNTLSNIVSLMDTDPVNAKTMQMDLIRYLRTALGRTRDQETTLGQELELIRAYLDIFKVRMGERLQYAIDVPQSLTGQPMAPLLLQPIVENALLHGLSPKIDGGHIQIIADTNGRILKIEISDSGVGMADHQQPGVGLSNVRARLAQLYGSQGRLVIKARQPCGVTVVVEVPFADGHDGYHRNTSKVRHAKP